MAKQLLDVAEADVATIATEMDAVRQKVCEIDTATCDELTELTLAMMEAEAEAIPEEPTPG